VYALAEAIFIGFVSLRIMESCICYNRTYLGKRIHSSARGK
jgi:hypothetical protein